MSDSRDLALLKTIAEALNGAISVDQALQTTLEQVAALLGLETGWIWLTDPSSGQYYTAVAQADPARARPPLDDCLAGRCRDRTGASRGRKRECRAARRTGTPGAGD